MYTPRVVEQDADEMFVHSLGKSGLWGVYQGVKQTAAGTANYISANRAMFYPLVVHRPYLMSRWWWHNGAAVGTNTFQVGIYDQDFNLMKASPRALSAGTVNLLQFVNPGIHGTNIINASSTTDGTSFTTASVTLKTGVLYLLSVTNSHASSASVISSVTNGFTSRSTTQWNGTLNRTSVWSLVPTTDITGTLTIDFGGGNTQTGASWSLDAFYHVDTTTNDGIVQSVTGTGTGTTMTATLAAFSSVNNATFGAFSNVNAGGTTEEANYLKLCTRSYTTPNNELATVYRPDNDTSVTATIGASAAWGACAVEIKSLGTGPVLIPRMRGWLAFHGDGITAQLFRRSFNDAQSNVYQQNALTTGLPATAVPASAGNTFIVCCGFTRSTSP